MLNLIRKCKPKSPFESIILITLFNASYNSILENYSIAISNYFICFLCFAIIIIEKRFQFSQVLTLECIIFIHFLQQIIFFGIGSSWMTYYFLPFLQHQEYLRLLILLSILVQSSLQFEGYATSTFVQNIVNCLIIFLVQLFKLDTKQSLIEQAKECIQKYYTNQIVLKIFDKNLQDLTEFENIDSDVGNAYTPITSDRMTSSAIVPFKRKDLTYKIYYNNVEQILLSTEMISQQFQVMIFKDTKSLLEGYLNLKQEKKISLILAVETDYKRKKKIKHHLIILEFKPNYFCLAYQIVNDGLIQKYSNSVALFKSNLQSIFTHKLKTPLNAALGYLQIANIELQQHNVAPSICNQIHYAYLNSRLQLYFVQDLLDFTSQNSDQIILQINKLNLKLLLKNIHDIVEYQCQAKGIGLKFTINNIDWTQEERIYHIYTDQLKLERVLYNILNNSYRYTNTGGILELNLLPDEFNNQYTFDIIDNTNMNDEEIENYNTQLALQNQFYYIGKTIQKQSKYKLGLTMKITNKLIYLMSDKTSYLSIKKISEKQHCFSFSIQSITNQVFCDPNRQSIQQRSKLQSIVMSESKVLQKQNMLHQSYDEVSEEPYPSKPINTTSLNRTLYIQRLDDQVKLDQSQNSLFQSLQSNYKLQQSTDLIRRNNRYKLSDINLFSNQKNIIAESIDIKGDQDAIIMMVDDEPFNHDILTLMLKPLGFHKFVRAYNGQQCIEIVEKGDHQIKVIFMDLDMPVMGGIQATKILYQLMSNDKLPYIPIIGCTAHDDKQTHEECHQVGMIHVVVKPVFNKALQEAFTKVFRSQLDPRKKEFHELQLFFYTKQFILTVYMFVKIYVKTREFYTLIFPLVCIISLEITLTLISKHYLPLIGLVIILITCLCNIHQKIKSNLILENILIFGNYIYFLLMYGHTYCWLSIYFCQNQQKQSQILLFLILVILLIEQILQFEGFQRPTNIQFIFITSFILISRIIYRYSILYQIQVIKENQKNNENINIQIFDESFKKTYETSTNIQNNQIQDNYDQFTDVNFNNGIKQIPIDIVSHIYKIYYNDEQQEQNSSRILYTNTNKIVLSDIQSVLKEYLNKDPLCIQLIVEINKNTISSEKIISQIKIIKKNNEYYVIHSKIDQTILKYYQNKNKNYKYKLVKIFTHKLKTPLNATLGYLSMIQTEVLNLQQIKEHIKNAYVNCKLQLYFVYDLLDYSVQNNGQINLSPGKINLKVMMNNIFDLIYYQCCQKDISINFMINNIDWKQVNENIYFYSDQLKLERILYNLLNDSYRKTNIGGQLSLNIQISPNLYYFIITDNNLLDPNEIININSQLQIQKQLNSNINYSYQKIELTTKLINQLIMLLSDQQSQLTIQLSDQKKEMNYSFFIVSLQYYQNYQINQSSDQIIKPYRMRSQNQTVNSSLHYYNPLLNDSFDEISEEPQIRHLPIIQHNVKKEVQVRSNINLKNKNLFRIIESPIKVNSPSRQVDVFRRLTIRQLQTDSVELKIEIGDIIMTVDDEPFNHDILSLMLQGLGFKQFKKAFNGVDCIKQLQMNNNNIKAIFMDLDMPVMGGIQTTKTLIQMMNKNEIPHIPIIGCTAHDDIETHQECYEAGMIFIVVKPIFKRTLKEGFLRIEEMNKDQQIIQLNSIKNIEISQL